MVSVDLMPDGRLVRERDGVAETLVPRADLTRIDQTTEVKIAAQEVEDEAQARAVAVAYARRVRRRTGLTQAEFAARIGVPIDTVGNWEQDKRTPPARPGHYCACSTGRRKRRWPRLSERADERRRVPVGLSTGQYRWSDNCVAPQFRV